MKDRTTTDLSRTLAWGRRDLLRAAWALPAALYGCSLQTAHPFTIVVLPDTQGYTRNRPDIFFRQTAWIRDQKEAENIVFVLHVGDITEYNAPDEWLVAEQAMNTLDGHVPFALTVGNHDLGPRGRAINRDASAFNRHFGLARFARKPWFGGCFEGGIENAFYQLDAGGIGWLILCLEFGPRDAVLAWADDVIAHHAERRVIVTTHCFTNFDDTRVGPEDRHNPRKYPIRGNDGEEVWTKCLRKHRNVALVLSGHVLGDGAGRLTSRGKHGNTVHQLLANFQHRRNGGDGWLRLLRFIPARGRIEVRTYSPLRDRWSDDDQHSFDLVAPMA